MSRTQHCNCNCNCNCNRRDNGLEEMARIMRMMMSKDYEPTEMVQLERKRREKSCREEIINIPVSACIFNPDDELCVTTKSDIMDLLNSVTPVDFLPEIEYVIFKEPYTIVLWSDDTITKVGCEQDDTYSTFAGLCMCIVKKMLGKEIFEQLKEDLPFYEEGSRLRLKKSEMEEKRKTENVSAKPDEQDDKRTETSVTDEVNTSDEDDSDDDYVLER